MLATAASACCVPVAAPLLVGALGVSGAVWAAALDPYSALVLTVAGLCLAYGFWTVYRRRPVAEGAACPRRRPKLVRGVMWISASLWLVALGLNLVRVL